MREQDMRMRVFRFLKARLRNMIMPATVGIGLAVGGCAKEGLTATDSAVARDNAAPLEDAVSPPSDVLGGPSDVVASDGRETQAAGDISLGRDAPVYGIDMTPNPRDAATEASARDGEDDSSGHIDQAVATDGGGADRASDLIFVKYGVPFPDASVDTSVPNPDGAAGDVSTPRDSLPIRYAAVMPDSGREVMLTLYAAPQPS